MRVTVRGQDVNEHFIRHRANKLAVRRRFLLKINRISYDAECRVWVVEFGHQEFAGTVAIYKFHEDDGNIAEHTPVKEIQTIIASQNACGRS